MSEDERTTEKLKLHQQEQETAEHRAVSESETEAEVETHKRRADKARYLREKLEQQEQADREVGN
jgi:hypothetical protein